jgi:hypothetical protein
MAITDGGHVAASRDPDAIARDIEQTRAELADTIEAIADRVSPKRVAERGAQVINTPTGRAVAVAGVLLVVAMFVRRRRSR